MSNAIPPLAQHSALHHTGIAAVAARHCTLQRACHQRRHCGTTPHPPWSAPAAARSGPCALSSRQCHHSRSATVADQQTAAAENTKVHLSCHHGGLTVFLACTQQACKESALDVQTWLVLITNFCAPRWSSLCTKKGRMQTLCALLYKQCPPTRPSCVSSGCATRKA